MFLHVAWMILWRMKLCLQAILTAHVNKLGVTGLGVSTPLRDNNQKVTPLLFEYMYLPTVVPRYFKLAGETKVYSK